MIEKNNNLSGYDFISEDFQEYLSEVEKESNIPAGTLKKLALSNIEVKKMNNEFEEKINNLEDAIIELNIKINELEIERDYFKEQSEKKDRILDFCKKIMDEVIEQKNKQILIIPEGCSEISIDSDYFLHIK